MTKPEKRVAVAKDVLKQLAAKKIKAVPGDYVYATTARKAENFTSLRGSLQPHLKELKSCEVCALGAAFISYVKLYNKVDFEDTQFLQGDSGSYGTTISAGRPDSVLQRIFSLDQLDLMEEAFEGPGLAFPNESEARRFHRKYSTPKKRLEAIMKNIVKNKGTFKP